MYVYAKRSCVTEWQGKAIHVHAGEVWAADDPFVQAKGEDLFGPPPRVRRTVAEVEQATRAPGEKRTYTRRAK